MFCILSPNPLLFAGDSFLLKLCGKTAEESMSCSSSGAFLSKVAIPSYLWLNYMVR